MKTAQAAAQQAITVAERLLDPERVVAAAPSRPGASLQSLAGTALLHARLAVVSPVFATAANTHWTAAATHTPRPRTARPGIFAAPGGLAASLILGENYLTDPDPHRSGVQQAVRWLSAQASSTASAHHDRLRHGPAAPSWALYDVITGLSGTGRILLAALTGGHSDAEPGLHAALNTLTVMILTSNGERPGWWMPADGHPSHVPASGVATTGLAHGIAGPLALLAIAHTAGYSVTGQHTAIRDAAHWLMRWRTTQTWPPYVTGDELDRGTADPLPRRRDAWCYGAPGISRALAIAGSTLDDPELTATGARAIASLADRTPLRWGVEGPSFCHGSAGVLRCAVPAPTTALHAAKAATEAFDARYAFGFRHLHQGQATDEPGLLTGAAGIALTLADYAELPTPDVPTQWDALLLLS